MIPYLQTTDADKVREGRDLPNKSRSVICQLVDVVEGISRDSCLVEMLEPEIAELFHVPWGLHCYMLWVAIHGCHCSFVHHVCFVRLAQLFILPHAGWQSSCESLVAVLPSAAMTEVDCNLFIPHIVNECNRLVTEQLIGMSLEILGGSLGGICCKVVLLQAWILPWQSCNPLVDPAVFINSPVIYCKDI